MICKKWFFTDVICTLKGEGEKSVFCKSNLIFQIQKITNSGMTGTVANAGHEVIWVFSFVKCFYSAKAGLNNYQRCLIINCTQNQIKALFQDKREMKSKKKRHRRIK